MNKKTIVIAVIVVVILAIISIVVYMIYKNKKQKEQEAMMQKAILEAQLANPSTPPADKPNIFTQLSVLAQQLKDLKK